VIVLTALVDHGHGRTARRAAASLASACRGAAARATLLEALRSAAPAALRCDDLVLALPDPHASEEGSSGGGAHGGPRGAGHSAAAVAPVAAAGAGSFSSHPAARAKAALRAMGAGSFSEDAFMDGSVHGGFARGTGAEECGAWGLVPLSPPPVPIIVVSGGAARRYG
jgi:hypothetical protein